MCCQNWPGLTWTPRPYRPTVLMLSLCPAWIARDKLNIKPMVGTYRKRSISVPELETSIHERWEQKLAKDIRKQQKIFYHPHVYVKNVGSCNFFVFVPLFANLFSMVWHWKPAIVTSKQTRLTFLSFYSEDTGTMSTKHYFVLFLGRVVRKPVNANPGLKVNRTVHFSWRVKVFVIAYVLCSLSLVKLKTLGQTV